MRRTFIVRFTSVTLLVLLPVSALSQESVVFGTVGNTTVTISDVQQRLARTGGPASGESLDEAINRVADEILAELVVERQLSRLPRLDPQLSEQLNQTRRQLMIDHFVQSNIERIAPSDEEIEAFISENPQFFEDRASFWINRFLVELPQGDYRAEFDEALNELRDGPLAAERILEFQRRLLDADVPFQRQSLWRSSEQISAELLARLELLYASGESINLSEAEGRGELLILLQRVADPVDAAVQRQQIVQGFIQRSMAEQRDVLIAELAASVRRGEEDEALDVVDDVIGGADIVVPDATSADHGKDEELVEVTREPSGDLVDEAEVPDTRGPRPWMFAIFGGLWLFFPLAVWSGKRIPQSLHPGSLQLKPARLSVTATVLAGLFASVWVAFGLWPSLGTQSAVALGGGGLVMGTLAAITWRRSLGKGKTDMKRETQRFAGIVAAQVLLLIAYLVSRLW